MKKLFFFLQLVLSVYVLNVSAQSWVQLNANYDSTFYDVYFVNQDVGFVCGDNGKILKTEDGGTTWASKSSGTSQGLACIQFVNNSVGYASSGFYQSYSTLIKTIDGGNTWTPTNFPQSKTGGGMWFLDADNGFYAYADDLYGPSVIAKTTDGGATWNTVYSGDGWISYFHFVDNMHGFATVNNGTILKTIDGGQSWISVNVPGSSWNSGIFFINKDTGLVGGGPPSNPNGMFKTNNAGNSWTTIPSSANMIFKIFFADADNGYALTVDNTGAGLMLKSTDGGDNWSSETTPVNDLRGLYFLNANLGYAVGNNGTILKYLNPLTIKEPKVNCFSVNPIPATDYIIITSNENNIINSKLSIYNADGRLIKIDVLEKEQQHVNIEGLNDGIYLIEIKSENNISRQKIIVKR